MTVDWLAALLGRMTGAAASSSRPPVPSSVVVVRPPAERVSGWVPGGGWSGPCALDVAAPDDPAVCVYCGQPLPH